MKNKWQILKSVRFGDNSPKWIVFPPNWKGDESPWKLENRFNSWHSAFNYVLVQIGAN